MGHLPCVIIELNQCRMDINVIAVYREGGGLQPLGDTFVLDTAANEWRWPADDGSNKPLPRNAATMDRADKHLVFHGGWAAFVETYNETWLLQL